MKKILLRVSYIALLGTIAPTFGIFSPAVAQVAKPSHVAAKSVGSAAHRGDPSTVPFESASGGVVSTWPLSSSVTVPGADSMPVWGHLQQQQSDGRGLHNIQVDPSNPMNVHAVLMEDTTDNPKDTNLFGRRLLYTFSSDGGHTWKTPDTLGSGTRTGFGCLILYKRNGVYVPIIAGHRYLSKSLTSSIESVIWVEQGAPGDGNFEMTPCSTTDADKIGANILWPYIGISPDAATIYIIGCESFNDPLSSNYIQYGTFSLVEGGKATFNGWTQDIGGQNENDGNAGYDQSGDYVLRVSPKGKVGILWRETDFGTPATNLNFVQSTDGGKTFDSTFSPIEQLVSGAVNGPDTSYGPWVGLDFFYAGENPKILWTNVLQLFNNDTNDYYPSVMSIHIFDMGSGNDYEPVSNINMDSAQNSLYGSLASYPLGTQISETDDWLAYPTIAQTSDTNTFSIFYQTFNGPDSAQLNSKTYKLYGSIYSQTTIDGGATWSAPTPYETNTGDAGTYGKIDFRWPQVSDWNPEVAGGVQATVMFGADSSAGANPTNGASDWDVVTFFHEQVLLSGVSNVAPQSSLNIDANFPNPFASSTKISFSLADESNVVLTVEDVLGRTIATLVNGPLGPGDHSVNFKAGGLPDGVYSYTLRADGQSVTKSMSLVR